jgi:hypothetical protein
MVLHDYSLFPFWRATSSKVYMKPTRGPVFALGIWTIVVRVRQCKWEKAKSQRADGLVEHLRPGIKPCSTQVSHWVFFFFSAASNVDVPQWCSGSSLCSVCIPVCDILICGVSLYCNLYLKYWGIKKGMWKLIHPSLRLKYKEFWALF